MAEYNESLSDPQHQEALLHDLEFHGLDPVNVEDDEDQSGKKVRMVTEAAGIVWAARRDFFQAAKEAGLNAHQALHSWTDAVEKEFINSTQITSVEFCSRRLAASLQCSGEELRNTPAFIVHWAIDQGLTLAEAQAAVERRMRAGDN